MAMTIETADASGIISFSGAGRAFRIAPLDRGASFPLQVYPDGQKTKKLDVLDTSVHTTEEPFTTLLIEGCPYTSNIFLNLGGSRYVVESAAQASDMGPDTHGRLPPVLLAAEELDTDYFANAGASISDTMDVGVVDISRYRYTWVSISTPGFSGGGASPSLQFFLSAVDRLNAGNLTGSLYVGAGSTNEYAGGTGLGGFIMCGEGVPSSDTTVASTRPWKSLAGLVSWNLSDNAPELVPNGIAPGNRVLITWWGQP